MKCEIERERTAIIRRFREVDAMRCNDYAASGFATSMSATHYRVKGSPNLTSVGMLSPS